MTRLQACRPVDHTHRRYRGFFQGGLNLEFWPTLNKILTHIKKRNLGFRSIQGSIFSLKPPTKGCGKKYGMWKKFGWLCLQVSKSPLFDPANHFSVALPAGFVCQNLFPQHMTVPRLDFEYYLTKSECGDNFFPQFELALYHRGKFSQLNTFCH